MTAKVFNVLFLCARNADRSLMAEAILNNLAVNAGRFRAYSAGSEPAWEVSLFALEQIRAAGLPVDGLRSKHWEAFAVPDGPAMQFVIVVGDMGAAERNPVWPGQPMMAHWEVPDPLAARGTPDQKRRAYSQAFVALYNRINMFTNLPIDKLDRIGLQRRLDRIGRN